VLQGIEAAEPTIQDEVESAFSLPSLSSHLAKSTRADPHLLLHFLLALYDTKDPATILRHLSRNQIISPQHLSPRKLLVPYPPQPNFSRAFPLGPPTSYGPTHDPFIRYGIDPLDPAKGALNPWIASEFVTTMGKIKARGKTGLQRKSQRKVGKAIRRARVRFFLFPLLSLFSFSPFPRLTLPFHTEHGHPPDVRCFRPGKEPLDEGSSGCNDQPSLPSLTAFSRATILLPVRILLPKQLPIACR
jgi:hypothetical protein